MISSQLCFAFGKTLARPHAFGIRSGGAAMIIIGITKIQAMNSENESIKRKGGRPRKVIKKSEQLAVMCNLIERKVIEANARKLNISASEYLREAGMKGQVVMKLKTLPKDVLLLTGTLNHIASSLNQIARKRNLNEELNALERAELDALHTTLKQLAVQIKNAIQ